MMTYAILSCGELVKVRGYVNEKGTLEWKHRAGSQGISLGPPYQDKREFCLWGERKKVFPNVPDEN